MWFMDCKAQAKELLSRMAHEASEFACEAVAAAYEKTGRELTEAEKGIIAMTGNFTAYFAMRFIDTVMENKNLLVCLLRPDED